MKTLAIISMVLAPLTICADIEEIQEMKSIRKELDEDIDPKWGPIYEEHQYHAKLRVKMINISLGQIREDLININEETELIEMMLGKEGDENYD